LFGFSPEKLLRSLIQEGDSHRNLMVRRASWSSTLEHYESDHRRIGKFRNFVQSQPANFDIIQE
jgi:hypothetical protein